MDTDFWNNWVIQNHSFSTVQRWAKQLNIFRFCKGYGGHGADEDAFRAAIPCSGIEHLNSQIGLLGLRVREKTQSDKVMQAGVGYSSNELKDYVSPVHDFPGYIQIGRCQIANQDAFVWITKDRATISLANDQWTVTDKEFEGAKIIEAQIRDCNIAYLDPPEDSERCVHPDKFPQFWG